MAPEQAADPAEFARRMVHMLNEAALALMVSVGHRTGGQQSRRRWTVRRC